jgi:hypothetical protein
MSGDGRRAAPCARASVRGAGALSRTGRDARRGFQPRLQLLDLGPSLLEIDRLAPAHQGIGKHLSQEAMPRNELGWLCSLAPEAPDGQCAQASAGNLQRYRQVGSDARSRAKFFVANRLVREIGRRGVGDRLASRSSLERRQHQRPPRPRAPSPRPRFQAISPQPRTLEPQAARGPSLGARVRARDALASGCVHGSRRRHEPAAVDVLLQLRDANDDGLRGHHARASPRARARGARGADRTALSHDHAGSPGVAGTTVPAGRLSASGANRSGSITGLLAPGARHQSTTLSRAFNSCSSEIMVRRSGTTGRRVITTSWTTTSLVNGTARMLRMSS